MALDRIDLTAKVRRDIANVCYALDDFGPDRLQDYFTGIYSLWNDPVSVLFATFSGTLS